MKITRTKLDDIDAMIEPMLRDARIPGAALAIVIDNETIFAKGYGYRNVEAKLAVSAETVYPIASTTKALNATLLGILVDEKKLAWDAPVQHYLPWFRLGDSYASTHVTMRDLLTMRTGFPRHDWMWIENPSSRIELAERLAYLPLAAGFRERFQYNNITVTVAGLVAEAVTGCRWEDLVSAKLLGPLGMSATGFGLAGTDNTTLSYHENRRREILPTTRFSTEVTAPSGGSIHSTVIDMARWIAFNLAEGTINDVPLIHSPTFREIHSPQIATGADPSAPTPTAAYAMGWFVDAYNGHSRLSHGGFLHDVNSDVMLFPTNRLGIVSFTNFGFPALARLINEHVFDHLMELTPVQALRDRLAEYERKVAETSARNASVQRIPDTSPSHPLDDYAGIYEHRGYGRIEIRRVDNELLFQRGRLLISLEHWHYDGWVARDPGIFFIHVATAFDPINRFLFETDADGRIGAVAIRFEPAVAAIRFAKR